MAWLAAPSRLGFHLSGGTGSQPSDLSWGCGLEPPEWFPGGGVGATQRVGSARNPTKPFVHFRGILELWGHQGAR